MNYYYSQKINYECFNILQTTGDNDNVILTIIAYCAGHKR
jgi:hypothetical protein